MKENEGKEEAGDKQKLTVIKNEEQKQEKYALIN
jgi:hypothetical protein